MSRFVLAAALFLCLLTAQVACGQAGVSSMTSSALQSGVRLRYEEIRVEELINFHRHQIPLPSVDQRVSLDVSSGKMADGKVAFQVGLATHRDIVKELRMPLNLVLVIDRSGSMSGDRIAKVKESLSKLVRILGPADLVSIVAYSDQAEVCLEPTRVRDNEKVDAAISRIEAEGSTNLHAGLMKGYELAHQCFDSNRANRVILLTDGIANRGVTNEVLIAKDSKEFNDLGIGLSTIGLGHSFNRSLLRELADAGNGAIHFIANENDIQKVFVDEFDSLLSPAAADIRVSITVPTGQSRPKIWGYEPEKILNGFEIPMEDMSYGATQVIVGRFKKEVPKHLYVCVKFSDLLTGEESQVKAKLDIGKIDGSDRSLRKNYAIAKVSNAIKKSTKLSESGSLEKASRKLADAVKYARLQFEVEADKDVDRVCKIADQQKMEINRARDRLVTRR